MFKNQYKFVSNNIEESLICSVCQQPFQEPVDSCCKHTFCQVCLQNLFENNEDCPICQQPFSSKEYQISVNSEIIKKKISYLEVQCPNYTNGCKSHIKLIDLGRHVENCMYREIKCPYGCDEKIIFNEKNEHVKTCCKTQDLCPFCQSTIEKGQQKSHYEKTCQCYPMKCVHSIYGCQEVVQRKDYNSHLNNCKYHKVRGLIVFSEISETMLRMFQDEIDQLHFEIEQFQEITGLIETDNEWKETQKKLFYQKKSSQNKQPPIKNNDPKKNQLTKMYSTPLNSNQKPNQAMKAFHKPQLSPVNQRKSMYIQIESKQSPIKKPDQSIPNKQPLPNNNNNQEINTQIEEQKTKIAKEEKKKTIETVEENSHTNTNKAIEIEIEKEIVPNQRTETEKEENDMNQKTNNTVNEKQIEIEKGIEIQNQNIKEEIKTKNENLKDTVIKIGNEKEIEEKENEQKENIEKENENEQNEKVENENEQKENIQKEKEEKEKVQSENEQKENEQKENEQKENEEKENEHKENEQRGNEQKENEEKEEKEHVEKEKLQSENEQNENEEKENVQNENVEKENEQKENIQKEKEQTENEEKEEKEHVEKENVQTQNEQKENEQKENIKKEENQIQTKKEFKLRGIDREVQSPDGSDFLRLDDELIFEIMDYLDVFSFFRLGLVNSKFQTIIRNSQRPWTLLDFTGVKFHGKKELVSILNSVSDARCVNLTDSLRYSNQRTIAEIIVTLMNFQNLESLILRKNFCNSLGEMFNILLPENNTLLHLDLSWNFMRHGVVHLATGLSNNFTLKSLDITQNYAKDEGAVALADSLKNHNKTLTELNISSNNIKQEGGNALVEMLKVNNTLKKLIVNYNSVGIKNDLEIKSLLKNK
ncbi:rich repeat and nacht domain-containing protein [Anaeramoeba flamelloides]|uniref:Rich repeat and nacht domain-containing protein n=1 Tax=Anaeramoeba flamelloides TaxID=1746091 RepID=A0AAV7Z5R6_9EUKA|nr:rich repeat and nacht domain-containing protein [Anaeramoeba flamelloides]